VTSVREENAAYPHEAGPADFPGEQRYKKGPDETGAWLAERFEEHRSRLRAVAYRMLGSFDEADDALQEAWIRFSAFRQVLVTMVVSQPPRLTTSSAPAALNRIHASCTASSASSNEPSIR
jgi:hypothetical protein